MLKHNKPNSESKETEFILGVRKTLDESLEQLDSTTISRLQAIRKDAIKQYSGIQSPGKQKQTGKWPSWVLPVSGFATIALAVVLSIGLWQQLNSDQNIMASIEDMSLLTDDEDLEFYEELEFYQWLADEESAG